MSSASLWMNIAIIGVSIGTLLILILRYKLPAFLALLIVSGGAGLALGMAPQKVLDAVRQGMGGTLGFIAIVVSLGAMLGALLEYAGGIKALSHALLKRVGANNAPWALSVVGFLIAIPVFFDVGFIIMAPLIYGLSRESGRHTVYYAIPLLAGLAAAHAFVPPTPGPIAVADLMNADLGWVILFGAVTALPAALVGGPLFAGVFLAHWQTQTPSANNLEHDDGKALIAASAALIVITIPLVLIVSATIANHIGLKGPINDALQFVGHPFSALIIALLFLYARLRLADDVGVETLSRVMSKAIEPAAAVILVTGAGGAFKQVLVESGVGARIAELAANGAVAPLLFGFLAAALVRVMQGSATVAMITAAGLTAPFAETANLTAPDTALVVVAIASGATVLSHVNDSGFWLVNRYLHLTPAETFRSWTIASTLVGVSGVTVAFVLSMLV